MALVTLPTCPVCGRPKRVRKPATPPGPSPQRAFVFRGRLRLVVSAETQAKRVAREAELVVWRAAHRDDLIRSCLGLVDRIAAKIGRRLPPHVSREELVSSGMAGLVRAADRFDPEQGSFRKFASSAVWGSIIDDLRSQSILKRRGLEKARRGEAQAFEHPLADEQDERPRGADDGVSLPPVQPTQLSTLITRDTLAALFERIPARDARLIRALWIDGETEEEIAARSGATPADVRRQAARALDALRALAGRG